MALASKPVLGFIGGTGPEGKGLALRFAAAGHPVVIGSRSADRAVAAATEINDKVEGGLATGADNTGAAKTASVVFLVVPYEGQGETLAALAPDLAGKVLVSAVAPLTFEGGRPRAVLPPGGSAALEAQATVPAARVTGAFHHLSARHLAALDHPLEGDVLVTGDDAAAKTLTMDLVAELPDLRPIDAGGLDIAWQLEALTALILGINRRYKTNAGVRIVGIKG
jgi:NADPH-dependent F420 reductase